MKKQSHFTIEKASYIHFGDVYLGGESDSFEFVMKNTSKKQRIFFVFSDPLPPQQFGRLLLTPFLFLSASKVGTLCLSEEKRAEYEEEMEQLLRKVKVHKRKGRPEIAGIIEAQLDKIKTIVNNSTASETNNTDEKCIVEEMRPKNGLRITLNPNVSVNISVIFYAKLLSILNTDIKCRSCSLSSRIIINESRYDDEESKKKIDFDVQIINPYESTDEQTSIKADSGLTTHMRRYSVTEPTDVNTKFNISDFKIYIPQEYLLEGINKTILLRNTNQSAFSIESNCKYPSFIRVSIPSSETAYGKIQLLCDDSAKSIQLISESDDNNDNTNDNTNITFILPSNKSITIYISCDLTHIEDIKENQQISNVLINSIISNNIIDTISLCVAPITPLFSTESNEISLEPSGTYILGSVLYTNLKITSLANEEINLKIECIDNKKYLYSIKFDENIILSPNEEKILDIQCVPFFYVNKLSFILNIKHTEFPYEEIGVVVSGNVTNSICFDFLDREESTINFGLCPILPYNVEDKNIPLAKIEKIKLKNISNLSLLLKVFTNLSKQCEIYTDAEGTDKIEYVKLNPDSIITLYIGLFPYISQEDQTNGKCREIKGGLIIQAYHNSSKIDFEEIKKKQPIYKTIMDIKAIVGVSFLTITSPDMIDENNIFNDIIFNKNDDSLTSITNITILNKSSHLELPYHVAIDPSSQIKTISFDFNPPTGLLKPLENQIINVQIKPKSCGLFKLCLKIYNNNYTNLFNSVIINGVIDEECLDIQIERKDKDNNIIILNSNNYHGGSVLLKPTDESFSYYLEKTEEDNDIIRLTNITNDVITIVPISKSPIIIEWIDTTNSNEEEFTVAKEFMLTYHEFISTDEDKLLDGNSGFIGNSIKIPSKGSVTAKIKFKQDKPVTFTKDTIDLGIKLDVKEKIGFLKYSNEITTINKVFWIDYEYCQSIFTYSPSTITLAPFISVQDTSNQQFICHINNVSHVLDSIEIGPLSDYVIIDEQKDSDNTVIKKENNTYIVKILPSSNIDLCFHIIFNKDNELFQTIGQNTISIPINNINNIKNKGNIEIKYEIIKNILSYPDKIILPVYNKDNEVFEQTFKIKNIYEEKITVTSDVIIDYDSSISITLLSQRNKKKLETVQLSANEEYEIILSLKTKRMSICDEKIKKSFEGTIILSCESKYFKQINITIPLLSEIKSIPDFNVNPENLIFFLTPSSQLNESFYYITNNGLSFTITNTENQPLSLQFSSTSYYFPDMKFRLDSNTRDTESDIIITNTLYPAVIPESLTIKPLQSEKFQITLINGNKTNEEDEIFIKDVKYISNNVLL